jgi:hypothetical protein
MNARRIVHVSLAIVGLAAAAGCSGRKTEWQRPKVVPAGGMVRYQGKPLEGALVTFSNSAQGLSASGRTDAQGKFTLTSFEEGDGALPGKHVVTVSKVQMPPTPDRSAPPRRGSARSPEMQPRWLIPQRYSNPATSGLTAEVGENGSTEIVLDLQGSL